MPSTYVRFRSESSETVLFLEVFDIISQQGRRNPGSNYYYSKSLFQISGTYQRPDCTKRFLSRTRPFYWLYKILVDTSMLLSYLLCPALPATLSKSFASTFSARICHSCWSTLSEDISVPRRIFPFHFFRRRQPRKYLVRKLIVY